ncbi:MAG: hypothetical protein IPO09_09540 [Anaeromyxobacter sp.]|nr:hypothetical protein [Anaeromyxobacter sp.]MBL0278644.1 hypothetical protein [Anaeromyxobacter sp.]
MTRASLAGLLLAVAACSEAGQPAGVKPTGYAAVSIAVDDTANRVFAGAELAWKGSFVYDPTTRIAVKDSVWPGPYPALFDDGPWTEGGHEGAGAVAGDHVLGATIFVKAPATPEEVASFLGYFEYGLIDVAYERPIPEGGFGNGWLWAGPLGSFSIALLSTRDVTARGMTLPAFGATDLRLTLDLSRLDPGDWDTSAVWIKSDAWSWGLVQLLDDGRKGDAAAGDGIFTFVLSEHAGAGRPLLHTGLLRSGQAPEFVWKLGGGLDTLTGEYKSSEGVALSGGATAATRPPGGSWTALPVLLCTANGSNQNTCVTVP